MLFRALAALKSFGRAWLLRSRMERDMDREMQFHVGARAADLEAHGMPRAEAERRARDEFGDVVRWKEAGRDARGLRLVDDLGADLRYAVRTMRRAPGFTATAVVSLVLGIGASTAIFGLMDLLLFRPLPVRSPDELVHVTTAGERGDANSGSSNYPWFREVASRTDLFSDAMLVRHDLYKVGIRGVVEPITGQRVTTNYTSEFMDPGNWFTMPIIARLKPNVAVANVGAQLDPLLQRFVRTGVTERFRRRYLERVAVASAAQGISDLREQFSRPLRLLMVAVTLLLLVACVNLAGLLVARNSARQHELGLRLALGAGRMRIMRQLLTESALLALLGAVPGVLLAVRGSNLLLEFLPPYFGPVSLSVAADWRVLAFALLATVTTALLSGVIPAWQAARFGVWPGMNRTSPRTSTARVQVGRALVVAQFALSLVLVAGAVLFLRTLVNLSAVETGFDRVHVLIVQIDPQGTSYEGDRLRSFQQDMLTALGGLPGVRHVSVATSSPFNGNMDGRRLTVPGVAPRDADDTVIQVNMVGAGYFDAFQIPIIRGRAIDARDRAGTPTVAVVSESFARRYYGDAGAAIGQRFTTGGGGSVVTREIVGVARDVRYQDLRRTSERLAYVPWFQAREVRSAPFEFVVRTDGDAANWITMTRSEMQRIRPDAPVLAIRTMTDVINGRLRSERLLATLGSFFAFVALMLAAVGVYGLLAHLVARRVPEIGVRLALGARPREIMWMTLREHLLLAITGSVIGIAGATAGLRVLEGLLFGLSATDTVSLAGAALILILVSLAAASVPARRAASVDPLVALRCE